VSNLRISFISFTLCIVTAPEKHEISPLYSWSPSSNSTTSSIGWKETSTAHRICQSNELQSVDWQSHRKK